VPGPTGKIGLTWTCTATATTTCTQQYIVSRASAVVATGPAVPVQGNPTSSQLETPEPVLAKKPGPTITLAANPR
jgi:hypothetical protein